MRRLIKIAAWIIFTFFLSLFLMFFLALANVGLIYDPIGYNDDLVIACLAVVWAGVAVYFFVNSEAFDLPED